MGQYVAQQGISVQNSQSIDLGRGFERLPKCRQRTQEQECQCKLAIQIDLFTRFYVPLLPRPQH